LEAKKGNGCERLSTFIAGHARNAANILNITQFTAQAKTGDIGVLE